jgi:acid stress-induced BolA-like protein IbaG/YrbA
MHPAEVKKLIESLLEEATVYIEGDGHHFDAIIIAPSFEGLSRIQRQQAVYAKIGHYITDGTIHALSFKTMTPAEWAASQ